MKLRHSISYLTLFLIGLTANSATAQVFVPAGLNPGDEYQLVFVTEGTIPATSSDIATYNNFVNAQAALNPTLTGAAPNIGVTYSAIVSTATTPLAPSVDARDNALVEAPVYLFDLVNSSEVATGFADMWDGDIGSSISIDQYGNSLGAAGGVWTGSVTDGTGDPDLQLGGMAFGTEGSLNESNILWIDAASTALFLPMRIYALSSKLTVPSVPVASWLNTTNTNSFWHVPANWSTGSVPASDADETFFDQNATYEVWWDATTGNTGAGIMTIAGDVTFKNLGDGYTHTPNGLTVFNGASLSLDGISLGNTAFDFTIEENANLTLANFATISIPSPEALDVRGNLQVNAFCSYTGEMLPIDGGGSVTVNGSGASILITAGDASFDIGTTVNGFGPGSLVISNGGQVTVLPGATTTIGSDGVVIIDDGRFDFSNSTVDSFRNVNVSSGTLTGLLTNTGLADVVDLPYLQNDQVDVSGVSLGNTGTLFGDASFNVFTFNFSTGELETFTGERMQFTDHSTPNEGEINNFGGEFRFEQCFNDPTGFVSGRGVFASNFPWLNDGVMAFSGGFADILGDVINSDLGMIAIAGNSTTTFYDDVTMTTGNPNINAFSGSTAVFFGSYNGGNSGTGTVEAFGDLRPGNSPGVVSFGGDLFLGHTATTEIELAGTDIGQFDQLNVAGDLNIDGNLTVTLIDGFTLDCNQEFVIANVDGTAFGTFANFNEGDIVGNFGGTELLISYIGGDGNDVVLQTPTVVLGDVNQDGAANLLDVAPFIDRLSTGTFQLEADINKDGVVNLLDIEPFVAILSGG